MRFALLLLLLPLAACTDAADAPANAEEGRLIAKASADVDAAMADAGKAAAKPR